MVLTVQTKIIGRDFKDDSQVVVPAYNMEFTVLLQFATT